MPKFPKALWIAAASVFMFAVIICAIFAAEHYEPTLQQAEREAKDQGEAKAVDILGTERVAYYTKVLAIFTGVLSGFGLLQIVFLIRADNTARLSAEASRQSAEALPTIERGYVFLRIANSNFQLRAKRRESAYSAASSLHVRFTFVNYGRTPAIIREIKVGVRRSAEELPADAWAEEPRLDVPVNVLGQGDTAGAGNLFDACDPEPMTDPIADQIQAANLFIYFFGHIQYEDVFGNDRETQFCWRLVRNRFEEWGGVKHNFRT